MAEKKTAEQLRADLVARLIDDPKGQRIALAALMATVAEERERCAKIADAYATRMRAAREDHAKHGRPTNVADCKADAGESIAAAIREAPPHG